MLNPGNALCYLLAGGEEDELELLAHLLQAGSLLHVQLELEHLCMVHKQQI